MANKNFRILSLDGGGSWAAIQVSALKTLFGTGTIAGQQVLQQFDLVVANSGGSIVAGALLANMTLDRLMQMFTSPAELNQIFVPASLADDPASYFLRHFLDQDIGAKYSAAAKLVRLQDVLHPYGDVPMDGLHGLMGGANYAGRQTNVVICGFDYDAQRETFFRSDAASLAASGTPPVPATLAQAIHASSNAPVNYFDEPALVGPRRYWDGAIGGYNNPVFAGVVEAIANMGRYGIADAHAIACLSLGSGTVTLLPPGTAADARFIAKKTTSTIPHDIIKMAQSILDDPPDAASFHAHITLGGRLPAAGAACIADGPVVRMNPVIQPLKDATGKWAAPADLAAQFDGLVNLDFDAHDQTAIDLIQALTKSWLADHANNQAIRANAATTAPEIGHGKFSAALAAWKTLRDA